MLGAGPPPGMQQQPPMMPTPSYEMRPQYSSPPYQTPYGTPNHGNSNLPQAQNLNADHHLSDMEMTKIKVMWLLIGVIGGSVITALQGWGFVWRLITTGSP